MMNSGHGRKNGRPTTIIKRRRHQREGAHRAEQQVDPAAISPPTDIASDSSRSIERALEEIQIERPGDDAQPQRQERVANRFAMQLDSHRLFLADVNLVLEPRRSPRWRPVPARAATRRCRR